MGKKKTNEEFVREVYDLVGDDYVFLEEYSKGKDKIKCLHTICGNEYMVRPNNFLHGKRCPSCSSKNKKTNEEFLKEVYDLVGDKYEFLEEYVNNQKKILCRHNIEECQYEYHVSPSAFTSAGRRCPHCSGNIRKTNQYFVRKVYELVGDEYSIIGNYVNAKTSLLIKHVSCGKEYEVKPDKFINSNSRCTRCAGIEKKTTDEFTKEIQQLVGDEYTFLDSYVNAKTKIRCIHNICEHEYMVRPNDFLNGNRCQKCKSSRGEKCISSILKKYNIKFIPQFKFDNCRNIRPLPFDFYLDEANICVEFDGIQHFEIVEMFGGEGNFKRTQMTDRIKNDYCFNNNIPLLRIPYWESENIEHILFDFLVEHGALEEIKG